MHRRIVISTLLLIAFLLTQKAGAACPDGRLSSAGLAAALAVTDSSARRAHLRDLVLEYAGIERSQQSPHQLEMIEGSVDGAIRAAGGIDSVDATRFAREVDQRMDLICPFAGENASTLAVRAAGERTSVMARTAESADAKPSDSSVDSGKQGPESVAERLSAAFKAALELEGEVTPGQYETKAKDMQDVFGKWANAHAKISYCTFGDEGDSCSSIELAKQIKASKDLKQLHGAGLESSACFEFFNKGRRNARWRCSAELSELMRKRFAEIDERAEEARVLKADSPEAKALAQLRDGLRPRLSPVVSAESRRQATYGIYVGPSYIHQVDGSWDAGAELLARYETSQEDCVLYKVAGANRGCRGIVDVSFVSPGTNIPDETDSDGLPIDPFGEDGVVEVAARYRIPLYSDWISLDVGIGATSPVQDGGSFNRVEPKVFAGFNFQTLFSDGMLGDLSIGVAHDRFWEYERVIMEDNVMTPDVNERMTMAIESFDRYYLEGTMLFPNLDLGGWRLAARLGVDAPLDGNDEAEVRASILFYYPFNDWLDGFKPTVKASQ